MAAAATFSTAASNYRSFEQGNQSFSSDSPSSLSTGQGIATVYADKGSFGHCMGYLTTEDLSRACQVSKSWRSFIDGSSGQFLWKNLSIREGVPLVEGSRDYKDEFSFLRPLTIGGRTMARYLGEIVGEVPRMRMDCYFKLRACQDPFAPTEFMRDNYVVLVDPAKLKITISPERPLALDASGTLVEVPDAEQAGIVPEKLTIPFSFKNLRVLAKYPLAGMEKGPVFHQNSMAEVFDQCNAPSDQNRILIMRREVVARNTPFNGDQGQNAQITNRRWEIITVRQRGLYDAIQILETGTCPDNQAPLTFARSSELVLLGGFDSKATIGGFAPGAGVIVRADYVFARGCVGVVPGGPAEVLRPFCETKNH